MCTPLKIFIVKANSGNLLKVDIFMVSEYLKSNSDFVSAEMRGVIFFLNYNIILVVACRMMSENIEAQ